MTLGSLQASRFCLENAAAPITLLMNWQPDFQPAKGDEDHSHAGAFSTLASRRQEVASRHTVPLWSRRVYLPE